MSGTSGSATVAVLLATELALLLLGVALVFTPSALPEPLFDLIDRRRDVLVSVVALVLIGLGVDLIVLAIL